MFTHTFFPFPFLPLDRRLFLPTAICREETSGAQVRAAGLWPVHSWVSGVAPALQGRAGALPEPPAWHAAARAAAGGAGLHRGRRCGTSSDRLRLRQETWVGVSYIISALRSPKKTERTQAPQAPELPRALSAPPPPSFRCREHQSLSGVAARPRAGASAPSRPQNRAGLRAARRAPPVDARHRPVRAATRRSP
jgi:hypothetical protein